MKTLPPLLLLPFLFLALLIAMAGFMERVPPPAKPEEVPAEKPVPGPGPTATQVVPADLEIGPPPSSS